MPICLILFIFGTKITRDDSVSHVISGSKGERSGLHKWFKVKVTQVFMVSTSWLPAYLTYLLYPPNNKVVGGYIGLTPSVSPSRLPCGLFNIFSSGWILSILATNDHCRERVCHTQWPLTYIFKVIWPWLITCVRSVAYTVLNGFFFYFAQMITIMRGYVAWYIIFRIWQFSFWANFSALTLKKIYSSRWILSIFCTNGH